MIQFYYNIIFSPNNDLSYVHINGTFMNKNQIQFECQCNDVSNTSGNLTIYIGLIAKDGRVFKDLHLIESVFVEFLTDNKHLNTNDPTHYSTSI